MKIIYLHQYFNTPKMSGGTRSYEMARRLVKQGHEVHMITSWRDDDRTGPEWFESTEEGIQVHWLPVAYSNSMPYPARIKAFFHFAYAAARKAIVLKGDVVFATSTPLTIALPAVFASRRQRIPMVFEVRDLWPELPIAIGALSNPLMRFSARKLEYWAYRNSTAIVALSPGMKDGIVHSGYPSERVAVIPNSSDNADFQAAPDEVEQFRADRPWLGDRPLVIYTGTFGKINDVGYMVDLAIELLRVDSGIRILLVGDGQEFEAVKAKARQAGVFEKNLFIEQKIPKEDIPAALGASQLASSLFVDMPEMQANSANKFFDALAAGTPIMINYGGWQRDLIMENNCGLCVWRKSTADAAEQVARYLRDARWSDDAGKAARQLAETRFDRDKLATELESVITHAVAGEASKAAAISPGTFNLISDYSRQETESAVRERRP